MFQWHFPDLCELSQRFFQTYRQRIGERVAQNQKTPGRHPSIVDLSDWDPFEDLLVPNPRLQSTMPPGKAKTPTKKEEVRIAPSASARKKAVSNSSKKKKAASTQIPVTTMASLHLDDEPLPKGAAKPPVEWELEGNGNYDHPNLAWCGKAKCVKYDEGEKEVDCVVFAMGLRADNGDITKSKAWLGYNSDGEPCIKTLTPVSHLRFRQDKTEILAMADVVFGESGARSDAFNRAMKGLHKAGVLEYFKPETFQLPALTTGQSYSNFIFNEVGDKKHDLKACIRVIKGGELLTLRVE